MRRFRFPIALLAVIGLGLVIERSSHREHWQPLPDGGQIRVVTVTYEKNARVTIGESIFEPLRNRLGSRWYRFFGPPPLVGTFQSEQPELMVWFTARFVGNNRFSSSHFSLVLGDKEVPVKTIVDTVMTTSEGGWELIGLAFTAAPTAEPRLHVRFAEGEPPLDQSIDFDAANPYYSSAGHPLPHSTSAP